MFERRSTLHVTCLTVIEASEVHVKGGQIGKTIPTVAADHGGLCGGPAASGGPYSGIDQWQVIGPISLI